MDDMQDNLIRAGLLDTFKKLPPSHRKEYIKWIDEAKKPETRHKRIQKMLIMLQQRTS